MHCIPLTLKTVFDTVEQECLVGRKFGKFGEWAAFYQTQICSMFPSNTNVFITHFPNFSC